MNQTVLIIHGWSDRSKNFKPLVNFLRSRNKRVLQVDYKSREDHLKFEDISDGLQDRLLELGIIASDGTAKGGQKLTAVVHSTGSLVVRDWIWRYYFRDADRISDCPIDKIVMLAPANFGSPLAHRGKSFLGSLVKGIKSLPDFLEVGRNLLDGLELSSPFQWELADRDLLLPQPYFTPRGIQVTVLVGNSPYEGLRKFVNKPDTDGTVVISGTNLDSVKFRLNPCLPGRSGSGDKPLASWAKSKNAVDTAFAIVPGINHSEIKDPGSNAFLGKALENAVECGDSDSFMAFKVWLKQTQPVTGNEVHQQFLIRAQDDQGASIDDYMIEFRIRRASREKEGLIVDQKSTAVERVLSERLGKITGKDFHRHSRSPGHRRFLVEVEKFKQLLDDAGQKLGDFCVALQMHVPKVDRGIRYRADAVRGVVIHDSRKPQQPSFVFENTTTLVEIVVDRYTTNSYVKIT